MSTPGDLLKHYLALALTEAGAGHHVRNRDVQAEIDAIAAALDRVDDLERRVTLLELAVADKGYA
jgi:hypothetical protein